MNIDKLPDDCFLHIFHFFYKLEELKNCSLVCSRWKYLVLQRLSNIKYLTDYEYIAMYPVNNTILYENGCRLNLTEISEWFPKLKILESSSDVTGFSDLNVEGLICSGDLDDSTLNNPSLRMLSIYSFSDLPVNDIQSSKIDQLHLRRCSISDFVENAKYFPNLKRLHIENSRLDNFTDDFYTGPVLVNMEILEIFCHTQWGDHMDYHGFSLADHCPNLKSAYHYIHRNNEFFVNSGIQNHILEDLVIHLDDSYPNWSRLRLILRKYPNLKHLAIRSDDTKISNENIPEILDLLPNIVLINIQDSRKVDENAVDYIDRYCRKHNRSISFYYQKRPKITKKWPHLLTKTTRIGRKLDFMKYCFLKNYNQLPYLLDSDV